jgi:hypothetical protein
LIEEEWIISLTCCDGLSGQIYSPIDTLGATTLSITALSVMTISITTLNVVTISITTLSVVTISITTLSVVTISITILIITTQSIKNKRNLQQMPLNIMTSTYSIMKLSLRTVNIATLINMTLRLKKQKYHTGNSKVKHNDTQNNNNKATLVRITHHAECRYVECHCTTVWAIVPEPNVIKLTSV